MINKELFCARYLLSAEEYEQGNNMRLRDSVRLSVRLKTYVKYVIKFTNACIGAKYGQKKGG